MRREALLPSCAVLLILSAMTWADQPRPYVGVDMDPTPLPELLTKHLRLDPGQGLRVSNIRVDGPADKAGLVRDDLIVTFAGQKVTDFDQFVAAIQQAGIGTDVALEVIHLGARKIIHLTLAAAPATQVQWKYEEEPLRRPGRGFLVGAGGKDLMEVPLDKLPVEVKSLFRPTYTYEHATGGDDYSLTIEGYPDDPASRIIVRDGAREHSATVGNIEALPEKYRAEAKEAVNDARSNVQFDIHIDGPPLPDTPNPDVPRRVFPRLPQPGLDQPSEPKDAALERLLGQIEQLQQRMKEMEEQNRAMLEKLLQRSETTKNQSTASQSVPEPSAPPQKQTM